MLGFLCGVVYALTNGVLIFVIQLVVNLIFGGNTADSVAQRLEKAPSFARPVVDQIIAWLPALRAPDSKFGLVLIILTIPTVMASLMTAIIARTHPPARWSTRMVAASPSFVRVPARGGTMRSTWTA